MAGYDVESSVKGALLFGFSQGKLSKKYSIEGIPTLVLLDGKTGKMITKDGRSIVMDDKEGKDFPWIPKKFPELMGDKPLLNKAGEEVKWASIEDEVVGLYFSAHWVSTPRGMKEEWCLEGEVFVGNVWREWCLGGGEWFFIHPVV